MRPARKLGGVAVVVLAALIVVLGPAMGWLSTGSTESPVTIAASPMSAGSSAVAPAATASAASGAGSAMISHAEESLAHGDGPAAGRSVSCSAPSAGAFKCSTPSTPRPVAHPVDRASAAVEAAAHPAVSGTPAWYNQTYYTNLQFFGGSGPTATFGAAAYDPVYDEVVFYGGCSYVCPANATWIYNEDGWYNATSEIFGYVPAAYGMSMAWDPAYDAILMVGGVNANDVVMNWTWGFYGGDDWENITVYVGSAGTVIGEPFNGTAYASMAWDGALQEMIMVNGCVTANCSIVWNVEWALDDFGWYDAGPGPTSGSGSAWDWGGAMAYDPVSHEMVYFGGYSLYPDRNSLNVTVILNSTGWWNITSTSASCFFIISCIWLYPADRAYASMTWDGQLNEIVLFGGYETGYGALNDTWYFNNGTWYESDFLESIAGPLPTWAAAMPSNSSDVAPMLIGGQCTTWCFNDSWVFEIPPAPETPVLAPDPSDAGVVVNVSAINTRGTGSGPIEYWYLYDAGTNFWTDIVFGANFSTALTEYANFTYTGSSSVDVYYEISDFFGVEGVSAGAPLTVNPEITLTPSATDNPTEAGSSVSFLSGVTGGTGTFDYTWGFGDHSALSHAAAPTHTYAAAGTFTAWVNVTDGIGWTNSSIPVTVDPTLTATAAPNFAATDLGDAVTLVASPAGGSGTYSSYAWTFGDSTDGAGGAPSHTYATTGTFTVHVTVTDSLGFTAEASTTVTINPDLTGAASASTLSPTTTTSVSFTATPTGGTPTYTYAWTFGDGGTSTSATPSHTYSTTGTFTATVVITDKVGGSVTKTLSITVSKAPTVLGLPPTEGYGLIAGIIILLVIIALAAVMMRRRRKPTSGSPTAWNQGSSTPPGTAPAAPPPTGGAPPTPPPGAS
jgi:PKD repeat protein